ncbi:MAG: hypothetical protein COY40_06780 [Alphaproteobacteria bacterium CG_4_10_14_0_8_um_filter_53_9]|nr:MAG: hypothetical protein COY40_06780 [Alphaproteobacteria bacterium CG_4_10_14_0_8_um_filter_53_9]
MMMLRLVLMMMLTLPVVALETVSVGNSDQNALNNAELKAGAKISIVEAATRHAQDTADNAQNSADTLAARLAKFEACAAQGKIFSPGKATADGAGCSSMATGEISNVSANHYCVFTKGTRSGNFFEVERVLYDACVLPPATCPTGTKVISCNYGRIDVPNNRCVTNLRSDQQMGTTAPVQYFGVPLKENCTTYYVGDTLQQSCTYPYAKIGGHNASYQERVEAVCMGQ